MFADYHRQRLASPLLVLLGVALFTVANTGCLPLTAATGSDDKEDDRPSIEESIEVPDAPPEELARLMHSVSEEALKLTQTPDAGRNGSTCSDELATKLFTGIKAAEKLTAHPAATDEQRSTARKKKLTLLYLGVQSDRAMFVRPLFDYVDRLLEEDPQGELAALAAALQLETRYLSQGVPKDDVVPKLADYAKTYPDSEAGVQLFRLYGEQLESKSDRAGARQCYQQAVALYEKLPEVESLRRRLKQLDRVEAKAVAYRKDLQLAAESKRSRIKQKLRNHRDGYFVVYAKQNVKPPRHGGMYFYRYEYEVLQGIPSVVSYAEGLSEKWSWQLVQRFPESPQGREDAYELWKKLLRKKKTGRTS